MKSIWKYICIGLIVALMGMFTISMITQNKLKDRIIELQENIPDTTFVEVHDTVTFDSIILKWKTRTEHDTLINLDTLKINDTIIILKEIESVPDSFSTTSRYLDSSIDATIHIEGRGVYEKTFIDSVALDYKYIKEELVPKKHCCWLKKIFCGCD